MRYSGQNLPICVLLRIGKAAQLEKLAGKICGRGVRILGFLTSLFGGEGLTIWSFGLALIIVLLLIVIAVWLLKLLFNATSQVGKNKDKRLAVIDMISVDSKRNLVLIRRDNVEHLVLIGGGHDVTVETGIPASDVHAAPLNAADTSNTKASPTQRTADAVSRLGLTGLLRRYNTDSTDARAPQPQSENQQTPVNTKQRVADAISRQNAQQDASQNTTPANVQQTPIDVHKPASLGPLDRLKALGMRSGEEVPQLLRHTGLLVPKDKKDQETVEEPMNVTLDDQIKAAEAADSAKMDPQAEDVDAMSTIEQGPAQQNGGTSNPMPTPNKAAPES